MTPIRALWVLPAAFAALAAGPAFADCAAINAKVKAALADRDVAAYGALHREMVAEPTCDAAYRDQVGRAMARSALTTLSTDASAKAIAATMQYGRPWQVLVALGDAYYDADDWGNAVKTYEEALDDMRDVQANPKPPPADVEKRVYKRAIEARALSPVFVATRGVRGAKTGLASPVFRNFTAESVPVPVRFDTASADLTPDGAAAVEDIYAYLETAAPDHVVIVGHTDPRGSAAYNYDLSQRRAESVAGYLVHLGYAGTIETVGLGEDQPFQPDDPAKYTVDQIYAFDRRVEYKVPQ